VSDALPVLVIGGAGFVGAELVHQLAAAGRAVRVLDNLATGRRANLADVPGDRLELIIADLRDHAALAAAMRGVRLVFHLACLGVRHSLHAPLETHDVNATGTLNALVAARAAGVARFVYVSSSEVYGSAARVPMDEGHPTNPTTIYGASKLAGEHYVNAFRRTHGLPAVVVRPFNAYGPRCHHEGDSGEVIPRFLLRAMAGRPAVIFGDGSQTRDFTHVGDTARGIRLAADSPLFEGVVNLGTGTEIAIADLARLVARIAGGAVPAPLHDAPRPGDVHRLCADIGRARTILGFAPRIALEEGIAELRDWYLASGRSPASLLEEEVVRAWEPSPPR
jgi:UDP-glucose 4-epimerase